MTAALPKPQAGADAAGPAAPVRVGGATETPVDDLFETLYADLCRMAHREVRNRGAAGLMGTETLVHEAWLNVEQRPSVIFTDARQFLAYASRMMRGLVIDRVRAQAAQKRGGGLPITSLDTHTAEQIAEPELLQSIGDALDELSALEPELAHVVDLKFFCGFNLAEVATMRGVSERTVQRQWEKARLLLLRALKAA
ncbi:MAG TPA: ECF-type sigma factor [Burkholderiaceae bacterium]|nr:ECF-type sigma factor [Burkholderiaceae bacterium]